VIFVPRATDISGIKDLAFFERVLEEGHEHNIPSIYRAPAWSGLKRYFVEWRKRALIRRELRMLSDGHSWEDIIPPTPPAHDI
jgi:hypothetical protein